MDSEDYSFYRRYFLNNRGSIGPYLEQLNDICLRHRLEVNEKRPFVGQTPDEKRETIRKLNLKEGR